MHCFISKVVCTGHFTFRCSLRYEGYTALLSLYGSGRRVWKEWWLQQTSPCSSPWASFFSCAPQQEPVVLYTYSPSPLQTDVLKPGKKPSRLWCFLNSSLFFLFLLFLFLLYIGVAPRRKLLCGLALTSPSPGKRLPGMEVCWQMAPNPPQRPSRATPGTSTTGQSPGWLLPSVGCLETVVKIKDQAVLV